MDEKYLEHADAATNAMIEAGIRKSSAKRPAPKNFDGFCNCGAEVSPIRTAHGFYNCVGCQTVIERHSKLHPGKR